MVGDESSREQSSCPTPVGTPFRAMLPGDALHLNMPSADVSPQAAFGALNPESLAALQAAFRKSLAEQDEDDKEQAGPGVKEEQRASMSDKALVDGQAEITTPVPAKEPKLASVSDGSPEAIVTPEISPKLVPEAAAGMKERLEAAQKEIERLKRSLEEGTAQQEWMLSNVVKSTAAEKEELTTALQAMQDECNALELELKHHEKEFAELVSEELEQRFMRFEEVTLAAVQKAIGIINAPAAGACPASFAAGMDLAALSLPGGMLTAPLGAVPPSMTLLEALQTRQAQDVLSALEAARAPSRHPLDISLQARARLESAVTTLCATARRRSPFSSRLVGVLGSARRSFVRGTRGAGGAVAGAGSTLGGRIALSARCIDHAADRAAAAAKRSVRARAGQVMHATDSSACWLRKKAKKENLGLFVRQVPSAACAPFKAFAAWSVQLEARMRRRGVGQVMEMYLAMAATTFYVAALGMWIVFASHALCAESRVAEERRSRKELDLKCKVCDLETVLTIERARAEEAEKATARAERCLKQAIKGARRLEREAAKTRRSDDGYPGDMVDISASPEGQSDEDINIWHMEPEELFSWNGFPELDLRGLVKKIRSRCRR
ncbi:hypothetical protein CVIRNUC_000790 [Coccomyxa viridis]|uniref:Uncharacterized protein n=1 Tax=Coccomyxa viridis TaxID=1274662 RepID=A0AAV1HRU0_9CHLO|nr:hypothetical protein CVIRNUC_000790 [Coccomyxa viridis]